MRGRSVIHFALLGAALFAGSRAIGGRLDAPLEIDAAAAAAAALSDHELLYRAALAGGLDRDDPVVQTRLIRNMRFLGDESSAPDVSYREAQRLGLGDADLVVRRRLVERMRRLLAAPALASEPSDAELQAYLDSHAQRFALPPRVRLAQVFLSRQLRGTAVATDAERLRRQLTPGDAARAATLGDALPIGAAPPLASEQDLARLFGPAFATAALRLEPGGWHGPVVSPYGVHLIWVYDRQAAAMPSLAAVRGVVRAALLDERAAAAVRDGLAGLRAGVGG
jgi:hypothetical protein